MTGIAVLFLAVAVVIIWGGLVTGTVMLARRPEIERYPDGGDAVEAEDHRGPAV
ncbi:methionine/alanine import family NSS transporter small subunit [Microbacterium resistens]|uniref:Methionine/alanine import family NSS transporter small subunit n=1 Tax=Microbacterium resistens TaxID=156977 RepID=A0ABY3RSM7_9MICO|nr:methionine/alanine import family NSS transporter small subunit [Microbacterium resistens]MBW1640651.1 methionine/alanine import family NSS transporter small subunit [Microbacterium resistens]UGS27054.1 methionine/alanine import family NSS transporter small subunit [Microbacterium resistens]